MNRLVLVALLAAYGAVSACTHCLALCHNAVTISLVDMQDAGVAPGTGSVTVNGITEAFDCSPPTWGSLLDGGSNVRVVCGAAELQVWGFTGEPSPITLNVTATGSSAAFSGEVSPTYTTGNTCGTICSGGAAQVTLR